MILISILSIVIALLLTVVVAVLLYKLSLRNSRLGLAKDLLINALVIIFVFFCISSFVYVLLINIL